MALVGLPNRAKPREHGEGCPVRTQVPPPAFRPVKISVILPVRGPGTLHRAQQASPGGEDRRQDPRRKSIFLKGVHLYSFPTFHSRAGRRVTELTKQLTMPMMATSPALTNPG